MVIRTNEGREVGKVAAVVIDSQSQAVTHIILGHLPETLEYRLVPAALIEEVDAEAIVLGIFSPLVESLPKYPDHNHRREQS
jgi:sporulation protein YlmC with PRC-barrel domain